MKINSTLLNKAYRIGVTTKDKKSSNSTVLPEGMNTDKVSMSSSALSASFAYKVSKNVAEEIESSYSTTSLEALKSAIQNGTYDVSNEKLADAILGKTWEA